MLILGGCGYVGGHLATTLLNNHYEVVIYDLLVISAGSPGYIKDVVYYEGNILDKAFLLEVTSRHAPFMVIHLSSYGMSGAAMLSHACDQINVEGVKNAIDACLQNNVECLLYTSTYNTCFAGQEIVDGDETYPTAPLSAHTDCYGPSKTVAEEYIERAHFTTYTHNPSETSARRKLNTYILRPAAIYGPDEARHFPRILQHMDSGEFVLVIMFMHAVAHVVFHHLCLTCVVFCFAWVNSSSDLMPGLALCVHIEASTDYLSVLIIAGHAL